MARSRSTSTPTMTVSISAWETSPPTRRVGVWTPSPSAETSGPSASSPTEAGTRLRKSWRPRPQTASNQGAMIGEVPQNHPLLVQFRDNPYPLYRYLLENAPVQWNDVLQAWTLARYADVVSMLTDPRFS